MKKMIALTLAGAMIFSTPVMAKEVGAPVAEYLKDSSYIGITAETVHAIDQDKVIGEHMNNAIVDIWAMDGESVQSLAIGQGAVLDGVEAPGLTFELAKPELKRVYAAKELAADKGTLLTVVSVHTHAAYDEAKLTFYAPGVQAGQPITVYQRVDDENWTACPTEVSDDQIVVDITANGHLAFIEATAVETKAVTETKTEEKKEAVAVTETAEEKEEADTAETKTEAVAEAAEEKEAAAETTVGNSTFAVTTDGETTTITEVK